MAAEKASSSTDRETAAVSSVPVAESIISSGGDSSKSSIQDGKETPVYPASTLPLADRASAFPPKYGPITDSILEVLHLRRREQDSEALDDIATQPSVYDGPLAKFHQPRSDWENIKAFDPSFRWTWREERSAIRKVDWKILTWVCIMFLALDIDRGNLTNATADNFLKDLGMTTNDYNLGNTLSKLGFLIAELPSQLVSKRLGPDRWIPIQILIFSVISASQFWLNGRSSFLATRFLIAFFQGGFIPDIILYLSYWYNGTDLPVRLAIFYTVNYSSDLLTSFLAVPLLKMRGIAGHAGWRWMFLLEGLLTLLIGIASFWLMPTSSATTVTKWRPNGYLTPKEVKIIVNRTIRDDPGKGEMHNRQALTLRMIWKSASDWHLWPLYILGIIFGIPGGPPKQYLQLSFKRLGFSTVNANLLTIPSTAWAIVNLVIIAIISEMVNNRALVCMSMSLWLFPCYIALMVVTNPSPWQYFAIATVLLAFPYVHSLQVSWASRNSGTIRTRTVSASLYNMTVQVSSIIMANVYQASDPNHVKANKALFAIVVFNIVVLYPGMYLFYKLINKSRAKKWNAMTTEEKEHYLATTTDEGNKRLDFQFAT